MKQNRLEQAHHARTAGVIFLHEKTILLTPNCV